MSEADRTFRPETRTEAYPGLEEAVSREVTRQVGALREELEALRERTVDDRAAIVVFSGDLDKVLAALVIATGAAAAGLETTLFFTFWGLAALKKGGGAGAGRSLKERMFALMTPGGSQELGTSKLNFLGLGARMLRSMMKEKGIASLEELMAVARDLGVRFMACTMSMDAMGVRQEQLVDGLEYGGVAAYMAEAARSRVTLFI
jgi:peroxiredoxin family protein